MTPKMQKIRDDLAKAFNMPNDFKVGFDAAVKLMQERENALVEALRKAILWAECISVKIPNPKNVNYNYLNEAREAISKIRGEM